MTHRLELAQTFDALLQPERFRDFGPNGLQVEGRPEVRKIVSGVTASLALIEAALAHGADALFVHHGLFWPAAGIGFAAVLRYGVGFVVVIPLATLLMHLTVVPVPRDFLVYSLASNTIATLAAACLVQRNTRRVLLQDESDVL